MGVESKAFTFTHCISESDVLASAFRLTQSGKEHVNPIELAKELNAEPSLIPVITQRLFALYGKGKVGLITWSENNSYEDVKYAFEVQLNS